MAVAHVSYKQVKKEFQIVPNSGQGNCLFLSLSTCLCKTNKFHKEIRALVCHYYKIFDKTRKWPPASLEDKLVQSMIVDDDENYVTNICRNHVWVGEMDIIATALIFSVNIEVYMQQPDSRLFGKLMYQNDNVNNDKPTISVIYLGFQHYEALMSKSEIHLGPIITNIEFPQSKGKKGKSRTKKTVKSNVNSNSNSNLNDELPEYSIYSDLDSLNRYVYEKEKPEMSQVLDSLERITEFILTRHQLYKT